MQKKWTYKSLDQDKYDNLQAQFKDKPLNPVLAKLLVKRDIETYDQAKDFFNPSLDMLHDPFLMKGMESAVTRIIQAIESKDRILIYGDYDVDGTTSVALMYQFLHQIHENIDYYIPDRYQEGYGVSIKGMDYAYETGVKLIISIDCGITAMKAIDYAASLGMDFIVCDHHNPSSQIPNAIAILDAKQKDCPYPFKELSGCGVGFKLCQGIALRLNMPEETYMNYIDLVAVSIASDIVPIVGENRILAHFGLKKLNENPQMGLFILKKIAGYEDREMSISDVVFYLGPRINAPGRMEHAKASVEVLMCQDLSIGEDLSIKLKTNNEDRRDADVFITKEAIGELDLDENLLNKRSIVLSSETWKKGVIGIVASRLVERYYKPTIILSENEGILTGSARSIKGFSIYDAISQCSEHLIQFGGHDFAAGLSLSKENLEAFVNQFEQIAVSQITEDMQSPEIEIDQDILFEDINSTFYYAMQRMSPFGPENMQPVFSSTQVRDAGGTKMVGSTGTHIKLNVKDKTGRQMSGICFGMGEFITIDELKSKPFDICYTIQMNEFRGVKSLDLVVKDIKFT